MNTSIANLQRVFSNLNWQPEQEDMQSPFSSFPPFSLQRKGATFFGFVFCGTDSEKWG